MDNETVSKNFIEQIIDKDIEEPVDIDVNVEGFDDKKWTSSIDLERWPSASVCTVHRGDEDGKDTCIERAFQVSLYFGA